MERSADSMTGSRNHGRINREIKTSEVIARNLASEIIDADMDTGTPLPSEKEMAAEFGVGRTTLREALRLLETRGVIRIRRGPGGGPVVRKPRPHDLSEALTLILQFEGASLREVMDARQALEPTIARLAAERISEADLRVLDRTIEDMLEDPADPEAFRECNSLFHATISRAAQSAALRAFIDSLWSIADGAVAGVEYSPGQHLAAARAHSRIVDAFRSRDGEQAASMMRDHLDEALDYWNRAYPELMSQPVRWVH